MSTRFTAKSRSFETQRALSTSTVSLSPPLKGAPSSRSSASTSAGTPPPSPLAAPGPDMTAASGPCCACRNAIGAMRRWLQASINSPDQERGPDSRAALGALAANATVLNCPSRPLALTKCRFHRLESLVNAPRSSSVAAGSRGRSRVAMPNQSETETDKGNTRGLSPPLPYPPLPHVPPCPSTRQPASISTPPASPSPHRAVRDAHLQHPQQPRPAPDRQPPHPRGRGAAGPPPHHAHAAVVHGQQRHGVSTAGS